MISISEVHVSGRLATVTLEDGHQFMMDESMVKRISAAIANNYEIRSKMKRSDCAECGPRQTSHKMVTSVIRNGDKSIELHSHVDQDRRIDLDASVIQSIKEALELSEHAENGWSTFQLMLANDVLITVREVNIIFEQGEFSLICPVEFFIKAARMYE